MRKLPPATIRTLESGGAWRERTYWEPLFATPADELDLSFEDWQDRVLAALRRPCSGAWWRTWT